MATVGEGTEEVSAAALPAAAQEAAALRHDIARRLTTVREGIAAACARAGRDPKSVTLLAVSKRHPAEAVAAALEQGQRDFGENYAQELRDKAAALAAASVAAPGAGPAAAQADGPIAGPAAGPIAGPAAGPIAGPAAGPIAWIGPPRWHFIGPLQRNKVRLVVGQAALIHSVDSVALIQAIAARAAGQGQVQHCLIQVNLGDEAQKSGCAAADLPALLDAFAAAGEPAAVRCLGLMCLPPAPPETGAADPAAAAELSRPYFRRLYQLLADMRKAPRPNVEPRELSMGMSHDFAIAVEEGATLLRIGTAIFGERERAPI